MSEVSKAPSLIDLFRRRNRPYEEVSKTLEGGIPCRVMGTKEEKAKLRELVARLAKSETGKATLKKAFQGGYSIELTSGLDGTLGVCDPNKKIVSLNASCSDDENVATLAHEMRHAVQFVNRMGSHTERDDTKTQIMMTRAMEADAEATAALATWELKQQGEEGPWKLFVQDGPTVAEAFVASVEKNGLETKENKNKALTEAFKGWYFNPRIRAAYDGGHVDFMKEIMAEGSAYLLQFDRNKKPETIIAGVCKSENGENYCLDKPSILLGEKYLSMSEKHLNALKRFMKEREQKYGLTPDPSLDEIPVAKSKTNSSKKGRNKIETIRKQPVGPLLSELLDETRGKNKIDTIRKTAVMPIFSEKLLQKQEEAAAKIVASRLAKKTKKEPTDAIKKIVAKRKER